MGNMAAQNAARGRIEALLDAGSFVEIGGAVTARATDFNLQEKETPADGVLTGYGVIDGNLAYVFSQDASVLNGAVGEMHAKKIANIYDMAMKMGAPVIGMIDCAGFRLQEATDALEAFGMLYKKQVLASGVIPQIIAIFGTCGGGLSVVPALADFAFMEEKNARLFVNSPNAIPGNDISKCDTSSAKFQSEKAGLIDAVGTQEEILENIRTLTGLLPANNQDSAYGECTDDLNRLCGGIEDIAEDPAEVLSMISDGNLFFETKRDFAREMVTGFIRLDGVTVGAVANRLRIYHEEGETEAEFDGSLTSGGAKKAAEFVRICDAFNIPVVSLTDVSGFFAGKCSEKGLARSVAGLVQAFAEATVPKVNVITGKALGSAYVAMNSKSLGADIVYAWPQAEIGAMDADLAARIMYADKDAQTIQENADKYRTLQSSPRSAAGRGYVDVVIEPEETRKYLIGAFEMLSTKREGRPYKKHGAV